MTNFTKGPWTIKGDAVGIVDQPDTQSYGMLNFIAFIYRHDFKEQSEANAHLISAAPDMYEALEQVTKYMEWAFGEEDPYVKQGKKALAKARGES